MAKFFTVSEFRRIMRSWLKDEGVSVPQAANEMQLSSRTLYNFLDGRAPSVDTLHAMAKCLNGGAGVYLP